MRRTRTPRRGWMLWERAGRHQAPPRAPNRWLAYRAARTPACPFRLPGCLAPTGRQTRTATSSPTTARWPRRPRTRPPAPPGGALGIVRELVGWSVPHTFGQLGCAEARLGDLDDAEAHLREATGLCSRPRSRRPPPWSWSATPWSRSAAAGRSGRHSCWPPPTPTGRRRPPGGNSAPRRRCGWRSANDSRSSKIGANAGDGTGNPLPCCQGPSTRLTAAATRKITPMSTNASAFGSRRGCLPTTRLARSKLLTCRGS